jgi:hypothetical protein
MYKFNIGHTAFKSAEQDTVIIINDSIRFLKLLAYDSDDRIIVDSVYTSKGQVNLYEFCTYSNGQNVSLSGIRNTAVQTNTVDNYNWNVIADTAYPHVLTNSSINNNGSRLLMIDGLLNTRWESNRDFDPDTISVLIDMKDSYVIDSVKLYFDKFHVSFDLWVSSDSLNWTLIGNDEIVLPLPVEIPE